jgi:MOSC domain-containing protein YiiM
MERLLAAELVADVGLAGCAHARAGTDRQVLIMDKETLDALELLPGTIRENITTEGINVNGLEPGDRLRIGEAVLQIAMPCAPCSLMDKIRPGLRKEIRGRRGMLCRVLRGGMIHTGDAIEKVATAG